MAKRKTTDPRNDLTPAQHAERAKMLDELTARNIEDIARLEQAARAKRGRSDRVADVVTSFAGSMVFVYIHIGWFAAWVVWNSLPVVPKAWRIDPFPFEFLTLVVSLEAIFLSVFILITQNHEERLTERRNHLDLQINLLSEQENSKMLAMLDAIQRKLGITDDDPELHVLEQATHPDRLAEQIDKIVEHREKRKPKAGKRSDGQT